LEDARIARETFDELKAAGGDRKRAGWNGTRSPARST